MAGPGDFDRIIICDHRHCMADWQTEQVSSDDRPG